jgi:curved DNA-binding protein CbpA
LEPGATFAEVKVAFRRLAAENHPDRCASGSPAERQRRVLRLTELTSAYHELLALQFAPGA